MLKIVVTCLAAHFQSILNTNDKKKIIQKLKPDSIDNVLMGRFL